MDGNGRWARRRLLPRVAGHRRGSDTVHMLVDGALHHGIPYVTLFAFSTENWQRPQEEVGLLMTLFSHMLEKEAHHLNESGVRLLIIGERTALSDQLQQQIAAAERLTAANQRLTLTLAINYGGRWDIVQAANKHWQNHPGRPMTEQALAVHLSLSHLPEPDFFIRTGGDQRVSNFLLWQLAYTELYFTPTLWPEFDRAELDHALASYRLRERRFGRTSEQCSAPG